MSLYFFIAPFISSFLFSAISIPILIRLAYAYNIVDIPDNKLKKHGKPVAYLGGVAIYLGILATTLIFFHNNSELLFLVFGLGCFLLLGLFDDRWPINPYQKFLGQSLIAIFFVMVGFSLNEPNLPECFNYGISIFWILSVVNAFNLVDIMDGLSTVIALGSIFIFFACAIVLNSYEIARFLLSMTGSIIPFFFINYPPARMYLGDAGSLMLGGLLAVISFTLPWTSFTGFGNIAPPAILGLILLECLSLIIIRLYKGIPPYKGSRDHFAHYLIDNGWSKKAILGYVAFLSVYIGFVVSLFVSGKISLTTAALNSLLFLIIWVSFLRMSIKSLS